jgi:ankyrin repeat protein
MGISQDALSRHQHLIMATLTEAINNEKREDNIYFDQDRERDLDEKEEMKGRPQSANGDSIDQMSQDGNPKSVPQVRVKQAKRAFWVPRFVYKATKTNEKNSSQRLLGKQSLEGELDENELFQAAAKGDVDKIYLLVKNGADLNMKNREQDTLLVFGARYGHEFLVRVLLQVEVGYKYDKDDCGKALSVAAESGHKGVVQALIKQGPDVVDWVDHVDDKGLTALHKAAASGHERIVQMILESRASVHMLDYLDDTALHKAVKSDHLNIIRLFLKRGAEVDAKAYAEASEGGLEIIRRYIH